MIVNETYSIFKGKHDDEPGYGVRGSATGVLYEANMRKDTAERIAQLENSANPPKDWEATTVILEAEGFEVSAVTAAQADEPSPGRLNLGEARVVPRASTNGSLTRGDFKVEAAIDDDGHLTLIVKSTDGTPVVDIEDEVGCSDGEIGYRLTTEKIEAAYHAGQA
jgi:hypothetical protein